MSYNTRISQNANNSFIKKIQMQTTTTGNSFQIKKFYNVPYQPRFIRDKHKNIIQNKTFTDAYIKGNTSYHNIHDKKQTHQLDKNQYQEQNKNQYCYQGQSQKYKYLNRQAQKQKENWSSLLNINNSQISQIRLQNSNNNSSSDLFKNDQINMSKNFNFTLPNVSIINESTIMEENNYYEQKPNIQENSIELGSSNIKLNQDQRTKNQILNSLLFSKSQQPQPQTTQQQYQFKNQLYKTNQKQTNQQIVLTKKTTKNSTYKKIFLEYSPADDNSSANDFSSSKKTISQSFITYNNDQNSLLLSGFNQQDMATSSYINKSNNISKIQISQYTSNSILQKESENKSILIINSKNKNLCQYDYQKPFVTHAESYKLKNQNRSKNHDQNTLQKSFQQNLLNGYQINDSKRDIQIFANSSDKDYQKLRCFDRQTQIKTSENQSPSHDTSLFLLQGYNSITPKKQVKPLSLSSLSFLQSRNKQKALEIKDKNYVKFAPFSLFQNQVFEVKTFSDQKTFLKLHITKIFDFSQQFQILSLLKRLKSHFQQKMFKILQFYKTFCKALTQDNFSLLKKYLFLNNIAFRNDQFTEMILTLNNCINYCLNNTKSQENIEQWQIFESFLFSNHNQMTQTLQVEISLKAQLLKKLKYKNIWDFFTSQQTTQKKLKQIIWKQFINLIQKLFKA